MTGLEVLQSVEFLNLKGKKVAVLDVETWQALIEWLETLEDLQIAKKALNELKAAGGNRDRAGWLDWEAVKDKWMKIEVITSRNYARVSETGFFYENLSHSPTDSVKNPVSLA